MNQVGVLLLGHGSRAQKANDGMYEVLEALRDQRKYRIVETGFMGLNPPTIEEGAAACIAQGARTVLMIPYFLHTGIHVQQDLPEKVRLLEARYPDVKFALGQPLGFHHKLVDIVVDRIAECREDLKKRGGAPSAPAEEDDGLQPVPAGPLRSGYTTGACAAAAARAAAQALLTGQAVDQVEIYLPAGQWASFHVERCQTGTGQVTCSVIKDGGDDPDATHGAEIQATVSWQAEAGLTMAGGPGVGTVTKPGLELPVGEPAINPVPRQMIQAAVTEALGPALAERGARVTISVPRGEEIARKTLNPRLGILGGISILGTTGIVVPFSTAAYTASITQALGVAIAAGCQEVVLTTGRRSERFAQALLRLPEEAFVQMGDFVGFALEDCARRSIRRVTICAMVGKLSKIAAGHFQTHVSSSNIEQAFLAEVAAQCGAVPAVVRAIAEANTIRHVAELVVENRVTGMFQRLSAIAAARCRAHVQERLDVECILTDFDGEVLGRASANG